MNKDYNTQTEKYPQFIIFHSGGSGGDFLCSVINYLYYNNKSFINITNNGRNDVTMYADFKEFTKNIAEEKQNNFIFDEYYALASHDYSPKLKELYPESKFYYIDYTENETQVYKRFFSLLFKNNADAFIIKLKKNNFFGKKLQSKITIDNLDIVAHLMWKKWLKGYEFYNLEKIPLGIFFDYELFSKTLEEKFLLAPDDYVKVMFDNWQEKNKQFFKQLQVD